MMVVTHEMDFARDVADRCIFMADGVIVEEGEPRALFDSPQTERLRTFLTRHHARQERESAAESIESV
jgi:ABC-type polar amino acid transport system ATPase subunit